MEYHSFHGIPESGIPDSFNFDSVCFFKYLIHFVHKKETFFVAYYNMFRDNLHNAANITALYITRFVFISIYTLQIAVL